MKHPITKRDTHRCMFEQSAAQTQWNPQIVGVKMSPTGSPSNSTATVSVAQKLTVIRKLALIELRKALNDRKNAQPGDDLSVISKTADEDIDLLRITWAPDTGEILEAWFL